MRPSDVMVLEADSSKFRKATGWKPKYDINDICQTALDYWRDKIR
jgi:GDP-4-dehydro-6-deoxy-D-mannose reductase